MRCAAPALMNWASWPARMNRAPFSFLIYPIDPDKAKVETTDRPVISVVVSFPDSEAADDRVYRINSVSQREES